MFNCKTLPIVDYDSVIILRDYFTWLFYVIICRAIMAELHEQSKRQKLDDDLETPGEGYEGTAWWANNSPTVLHVLAHVLAHAPFKLCMSYCRYLIIFNIAISYSIFVNLLYYLYPWYQVTKIINFMMELLLITRRPYFGYNNMNSFS